MNHPTDRPGSPVPRAGRPDVPAAAADVLAVAVFVLLGRTSHREGGAVTGYLATVWPFLVGAGVGWLALALAHRREADPARGGVLPVRSLRAGAVVLAGTVVVGMGLRRIFTDGGTPVSFLIVATTFLAVLLLGWRLAARWWTSRVARGEVAGPRPGS
jgi:hypothetical protein